MEDVGDFLDTTHEDTFAFIVKDANTVGYIFYWYEGVLRYSLPANPAICPQVDYVEALAHHQAELAVFISTTTGPLPQNRVEWYCPSGEEIEDTGPRVMFKP